MCHCSSRFQIQGNGMEICRFSVSATARTFSARQADQCSESCGCTSGRDPLERVGPPPQVFLQLFSLFQAEKLETATPDKRRTPLSHCSAFVAFQTSAQVEQVESTEGRGENCAAAGVNLVGSTKPCASERVCQSFAMGLRRTTADDRPAFSLSSNQGDHRVRQTLLTGFICLIREPCFVLHFTWVGSQSLLLCVQHALTL